MNRELPPIAKLAMRVLACVEEAVTRFPRKHRYTLGSDLLALAHQYATECGECAGTRVCPDDEPCTECGFIWDVINKAEGQS